MEPGLLTIIGMVFFIALLGYAGYKLFPAYSRFFQKSKKRFPNLIGAFALFGGKMGRQHPAADDVETETPKAKPIMYFIVLLIIAGFFLLNPANTATKTAALFGVPENWAFVLFLAVGVLLGVFFVLPKNPAE